MNTDPLDLLAPLLFFGTPAMLIVWGVVRRFSSPRKPSWYALAALGLWVVQAVPMIFTALLCLGGHCQLSPLQEFGPLILMVLAYIGIVSLVIAAFSMGDGAN